MVVKYILLLFLLLANSVHAQGSYALYDYKNKDYIVKYNTFETRSIASITKLFTAKIVVDSGVDLNEKIKVNGKSHGHVPAGVYMSRMDLLRAMIIGSDNRAAETLANHHPGGLTQFIIDVNRYAETHSLFNTKIADSTGLLAANTSTAFDLIEFLFQIQNDSVIRSIANERNAFLDVPRGKKTIHINVRNTNPELFVFDNILISKTGFTNAAGRCVLMLVEKNNDRYAVVVLGQKNVRDRSKLVKELLDVNFESTVSTKINGTIEFENVSP